MSSRIDVSIEHRNVPEPPGKQHPNTCPECQSHYRDDELEAALWVCPHCGHHFPMRARARVASLVDQGTFVEEAAEGLITVMTHPTTAGVLATFASLGDVIVAEPGALVAFTGPRVVQQTTREKLPEDFGLAEQNLRFGHIDAIVPRPELKPYVSRLLRLFSSNGD